MDLTISIAQIDVATSRPDLNLEKGAALISEAAGRGSELICFPEMWTTGFNWVENARIVEEHETIVERVAGLAKQWKIWISGSVIAANTGGKPTNASILFSPRGERAVTYNKTHLFSLMDEDEHVAPGDELVLFDAPWGKTGFAVCYDIRFPELYRSYALKGAEVLLNPTAFPHPRREHWRTLVRARAIENQMFMIGTNQVGFEEMGELGKVSWCGTSLIIDPWGNTVVEASETEEELLTASIEVDVVAKTRRKMRVLRDRRPDLYELGMEESGKSKVEG